MHRGVGRRTFGISGDTLGLKRFRALIRVTLRIIGGHFFSFVLGPSVALSRNSFFPVTSGKALSTVAVLTSLAIRAVAIAYVVAAFDPFHCSILLRNGELFLGIDDILFRSSGLSLCSSGWLLDCAALPFGSGELFLYTEGPFFRRGGLSLCSSGCLLGYGGLLFGRGGCFLFTGRLLLSSGLSLPCRGGFLFYDGERLFRSDGPFCRSIGALVCYERILHLTGELRRKLGSLHRPRRLLVHGGGLLVRSNVLALGGRGVLLRSDRALHRSGGLLL
mmetsp:Transcript_27423/g.83437  ORF Transcript_27423/g.83437 Transcript_27423/m.83437 type:complete len:276 (+) Transcript_27423:924-1751(+)